jgi:hypothetical protein
MTPAAKSALILGGAVVLAAGAIVVTSVVVKPAPPPPNYLALVKNPAVVKAAQNGLAATIGAGGFASKTASPILTAADWSGWNIDGNPENPKWVAALAKAQKAINALLPFDKKRPAGFPSQLRTDGVLDWATADILGPG